MQIELRDETFNLETKEIKGSLDFVIDVNKFCDRNHMEAYNGFTYKVYSKIEEMLLDRYLDNFEEKIIEGIDLENLIKRVQLKVIERIAR